MTFTTTRIPVARCTIGLTALSVLSVLALTGCGTNAGPAGFESGSGAAEEQAATPEHTTEPADDIERVEPGFVYDDISKDVTATATIRPQNAEIFTPSGTLTINSVQEVAAVAPDEVGLDAVEGDGGEPRDYGAAAGESLRIIDLSYVPKEEFPSDDAPTTDLSVEVGGAQEHLSTLDDQQDHRILVSAADDGSAQLVVSSEGHDQAVDVLTGERVDDDIAAAYYLPTTRQEPHHTFPIDDAALPTKSHTTPDEDVTTSYSFEIDSATLSAWTATDGWADPGQAWLVVDWNYRVTAEHPVIWGHINRFDAALAITVGDQVTEDKVHDEDKSGDVEDTRSTSVAVPIETTDVAISVSGDAEFDMLTGSGLEMAGEKTVDFSSESLEISFPRE